MAHPFSSNKAILAGSNNFGRFSGVLERTMNVKTQLWILENYK